MATTIHYGLEKPVKATSSALISDINGNMEILDSALNNVTGAVAIIQRTDTATQAISKDSFVIWKGILCKASSDIALGDTLSASNLTVITGGGLNDTSKSTLEIMHISAAYTIGTDKEYYKEWNYTPEGLNGKRIIGIAGVSSGSNYVSVSECNNMDYKVWIELRNLTYPSSVSEKTLRIDCLIG